MNFKTFCKVELHHHLDCSMRFSTMLELALNDSNYKKNLSLAQEKMLEKEYLIQEPFKDLGEVLRKFKNAQTFLKSEIILERLAYECIEDAFLDGVKVLELRYSPAYVQEVNLDLSYHQIHHAFYSGVMNACKKYPMAIGFIIIIQRNLSTEVAEKVADFAFSKPPLMVGLDLADNEEFDSMPYLPIFKKAKLNGIKLTLHAGEMPTAQSQKNIKDAIEIFQVDRIGHGIQSIKSKEICDLLIQKQIPLELCPTSNVLTQGVIEIRQHPIRKLWDQGIPLTLNSDDPGIFNIDLSGEYELVHNHFHFVESDFKKMNQIAFEKSFIPDEVLKNYKHFFY